MSYSNSPDKMQVSVGADRLYFLRTEEKDLDHEVAASFGPCSRPILERLATVDGTKGSFEELVVLVVLLLLTEEERWLVVTRGEFVRELDPKNVSELNSTDEADVGRLNRVQLYERLVQMIQMFSLNQQDIEFILKSQGY